jgi:SAM-dependent methyltransferase
LILGRLRLLRARGEDAAAAGASELRGLTARLREGSCVADAEFDEVFPFFARKASSKFWTPVSVARRAAQLLVQEGSTRVLDVGSGVGKFCIVGAASTNATFVGVEHRAHFVDVAREAACRTGVASAHFVHGTLDAVSASDFDGFYFFNPFEENLWDSDGQLDQTVPLSRERYDADVERALRMLIEARVGARVVTYHGFGNAMPGGYLLARRELHRSGFLNLWVKTVW